MLMIKKYPDKKLNTFERTLLNPKLLMVPSTTPSHPGALKNTMFSENATSSKWSIYNTHI